MDNILGDGIGGSCLGTKDQCDGTCRFLSFPDLPVFMYGIERIELLPLILMKALDLDVKDGILIQFNSLGLFQVKSQSVLICLLNFNETIQHPVILFIFQQLLQFPSILLKTAADGLREEVRQFPVAVDQPAPECDAVGLIVKLLRIQLIKVI